MYSKILIVGLMVAVGAVVEILHSSGISGEKIDPIQLYESAIVDRIKTCEYQAELLHSSQSVDLKNYGRIQAQVAQFLKTDKKKLVNSMAEMQIEPKKYKIERFLDDQFYKSLVK